MKCHYEILRVERDCTDHDIKKSYRKLALQWHPDKNPEKAEECTKKFHLIQQAYDVLIDPQERAWYDKHREAILQGGLGHGDDYQDKSVDVYQYFNTTCYFGYGDDEKGFYAVYSEVFNVIAQEDREFVDKGETWEPPAFGQSQSDYDEIVGPFYGFWNSYCTVKSYVWVEKYDTREAPNRMVRRLMEQDNRKLREKARKDRNEEVRALVAFVRKRDKRVQAQKKKLDERALEVARLTEEKKKRDKQDKLKKMSEYKETGWSATSEMQDSLAELEAKVVQQFGEQSNGTEESDSDAEDDQYDDLFCVACNKLFKTEKAYGNHEKSKKHKEFVGILQAHLLKEDEQLLGTGNQNEEDLLDDDGIIDELDENEIEQSTPKSKLSKKQKKKRRQQQKSVNKQNDLEEDMSELNLNGEECKAVVSDADCNNSKESSKTENTELSSRLLDADMPTSNEMRASLEAEDTPLPSSTQSQANKQKKEQNKQDHCTPQACNTCGKVYPSRNKLFQHVKVTGHALRVEATEEGSKSKAGKKKKGKR